MTTNIDMTKMAQNRMKRSLKEKAAAEKKAATAEKKAATEKEAAVAVANETNRAKLTTQLAKLEKTYKTEGQRNLTKTEKKIQHCKHQIVVFRHVLNTIQDTIKQIKETIKNRQDAGIVISLFKDRLVLGRLEKDLVKLYYEDSYRKNLFDTHFSTSNESGLRLNIKIDVLMHSLGKKTLWEYASMVKNTIISLKKLNESDKDTQAQIDKCIKELKRNDAIHLISYLLRRYRLFEDKTLVAKLRNKNNIIASLRGANAQLIKWMKVKTNIAYFMRLYNIDTTFSYEAKHDKYFPKLQGGRILSKIYTGSRGGKYMLKGGKKVYL